MNAPEQVADCACVLGDGPLWHAQERGLYWLDIGRKRVLRFDPRTGRHEICSEGTLVGGFTVQTDDSLLFFMEHGAVRTWRGKVLRTIVGEIPEERGSRFNDVIATPSGRVLCGVLPTPARQRGSIYLLDTSGRVTQVRGGFGCPNGMGFTPDRLRLYFTDSEARTIQRFDFDESTGLLGDSSVFVHLAEGDVPDGLTVDLEGFVWVALQGSGCVARFSPAGAEAGRITFPARLVTSVTFGGEDFRDLYVTSAGGDDPGINGSGAGALFRVPEAGQGVPEFFSRVGV